MFKEVCPSAFGDGNKKIIDITGEKKKMAGSSSQHGFNYQTTVSVLYLCMGKDLKNFHFVPELKEAGLFDDLVFCFETEDSQNKYCLLQVKHGLPENSGVITNINCEELFSEKQKGEFILWKYFQSYFQIRDKFQHGSAIEHLIIFTNSDFDTKNLLHEGIEICKIKNREMGLLPKNSFQFVKLAKEKRLQIIQKAGMKCDKTTNSVLDKFLELLVFAVKQPNYLEIDNTVKAKLAEVFNINEPETDRILATMQGKMWKLQSTKDHESLTPETISQEFVKYANEIKEKHLYGITFANCNRLLTKNYSKDIYPMKAFLKNNIPYISYISSVTPALTCLKLAQALLHVYQKRDYPELYFAILDLLTLEKDKKSMKNTLLCKKEFVLVIKCYEQHELATKMIEELIDDFQPEMKIILVCNDTCDLTNFTDCCKFENIYDSESFMNSVINLQGNNVTLAELIDIVQFEKLDSNVTLCNDLIEVSIQTIGKTIDNFESIDNYYIELLFKKKLKYAESLIQNIPKTMVLVFSGMVKSELIKLIPDMKLLEFQGITTEIGDHRAIFLNDNYNKDQQFKAICSKLKSKEIYWLENQSSSFSTKTSAELTMDTVIEVSTKMNILVGEPGSGKTIAIAKIMNRIKCYCPKNWTIKINLLAFNGSLKELQYKSMTKETILEFLCQAEGLNKSWEKHLLHYTLHETDNCYVFFDGFDEICPLYETTVIQMLKLCQDTKASIWVSSRPQFQNKLEKELACCSYSPIPFTNDQQKLFLEKYWLSKLEITQDRNEMQNLFDISCNFKASRIRFASEFIGIPLHTLMIADICYGIYHNEGKDNNDRFKGLDNILSFYDFFVAEKYQRYLNEKALLGTGNAVSTLLEISCKTSFSAIHKNAALTLLFSQELQSLLIDFEAESETQEEIHRVGLLVNENNCLNFTHRTFAEYFVAKRLGEILTNKKRYSEDCEKYKTVIKFLKKHYFAETNKMIRIFLDLMMANDDIHKAIIKNDVNTVMRLVVEDEKCIMQKDILQRTTWQLVASYLSKSSNVKCDAECRPMYDDDDKRIQFLNFEIPFSGRIFYCLNKSDAEEFFKTDKLGFNILCYAVVPVEYRRKNNAPSYTKTVLTKSVEEIEILNEIILNVIQVCHHVVAEYRQYMAGYLEIISHHPMDLGKYSNYIQFLVGNMNDIGKIKAFMQIAPHDFPWKSCPPKFFNHLLQTDPYFSEIISDEVINISYLRIKNILKSKELEKWFRRTMERKDYKRLIDIFKFISCPTFFPFLCDPGMKFKKVFKKALQMVMETDNNAVLCYFGGTCDNHFVHLEKLLINGSMEYFDKLFEEINADAKIEVLERLDYAKIANEVATKGDMRDLRNLLRMPIFQSKIERMKSGADYQQFISCFRQQITERKFLNVEIILLCISDKEKNHVRSILHCILDSHKESNGWKITMNDSSMPMLRVLQWLNCYPLERPSTFNWSFWEHMYCLIICKENNLNVPPSILGKLEPNYVIKIQANKAYFPSVRHLFYLATDKEKEEICKHNDWEFLLHAFVNYFIEITNDECGDGEYMKRMQNDIPVDGERFQFAFQDVLTTKRYTSAAKFMRFLNSEKQLSLWRTFYVDRLNHFENILNQNEPMEVDFIIHMMEVTKIIGNHNWLSNVHFPLNILCQFSVEKLDELSYHVKWEQVSEAMMKMGFPLNSFEIAVIEMDFLKLNEIIDKFRNLQGLVRLTWENVEFTHCIKYMKQCVENEDYEQLGSLLQCVPWKECIKSSFKIHKAFQIALKRKAFIIYKHSIKKTLITFLVDYSSHYHDAFKIWEYFLILFGCMELEWDDAIEFKELVLKELKICNNFIGPC